jgi:hypothetical protein
MARAPVTVVFVVAGLSAGAALAGFVQPRGTMGGR